MAEEQQKKKLAEETAKSEDEESAEIEAPVDESDDDNKISK